jgi:hypothetical protein
MHFSPVLFHVFMAWPAEGAKTANRKIAVTPEVMA